MATAVDKSLDVVVLSAFGRGHWLASELQSRGFRTKLIDFSMAFTLEECLWDGPSVFFEDTDGLSTMLSNYFEFEKAEKLTGLSVRTDRGIFESKGAMGAFLAKKLGVEAEVFDYLSPKSSVSVRKLLDLSFLQTWPARLSHFLYSRIECLPIHSLQANSKISIGRNLWVRSWEKSDWEAQLNSLQKNGIEILRVNQIQDFRLFGKSIEFLEVGRGRGEAVLGRTWVNLLSGAELTKVNPKLSEVLQMHFQNPEKIWVAADVSLEGDLAIKSLPTYFVDIHRLAEPWSHSNLAVCKAKNKTGVMQVWLRIPFVKSDDETYVRSQFEKYAQSLVQSSELKGAKVEKIYFSAKDEAPAFPIYSEDFAGKNRQCSFKNWFNMGPDAEMHLDWSYRFNFQYQAVQRLEKWREQAKKVRQVEVQP